MVGGESGNNVRVCSYSWVLNIREQCRQKGVVFNFRQTGARFEQDGKIYTIRRSLQHQQAQKAGIDLTSAWNLDYNK